MCLDGLGVMKQVHIVLQLYLQVGQHRQLLLQQCAVDSYLYAVVVPLALWWKCDRGQTG